MQIIQSIRDKGAAITIGVIALSLIGFILMDARSGSNRLFGGSQSTSIATVNGRDIDQSEFNKKLKEAEDNEKQQSQGAPINSTRSYQIKDQVYNQMVALEIFYAEAKKLGIDFNGKELDAILKSEDPSNPLKQDQQMIDPSTGRLDPTKVSQVIAEMKKSKNERRDFYNSKIVNPLKQASIVNKYTALLNAGAYYPSWQSEADNTNTKTFANISFTAIPYNVVPDSTVDVSDKDVEEYISKHKKLFKQEEGRMISYVTFSQKPTAEDSTRTKEEVARLQDEFSKITDSTAEAYFAKNNTKVPYRNEYLPKSQIQTTKIDSLTKLPFGTVLGPYADGVNYSIAKIFGSKSLPDSVKAKHILLPTGDPQGQPLDEGAAKKLADSLLTLIKGGASFDTLAKKYGTDATKDKGGDLGTFAYGAMVPEFNDSCFNKPEGTTDLVKTQFGWHVVKIVSQKNFNPAYKVAILARDIFAGDNTINKANLDALKLSSEKGAKKFDDYCAKNGLQKITVPNLIKETDNQVGVLQDARQLVRWVYDNKPGDVSEPFSMGDQFVVALIDKAFKEGTQDVATARPMAERAIKNQKIAATIIKNIGANATPESAAAKYGKQVQVAGADSSIIFNSNLINGLGNEPKVVGTIFSKNSQSTALPPIEGTQGVYVIKVNGFGNKPADTPEQAAQKAKNQENGLRQQVSANWYEGLKSQSSVKDHRTKLGY